MPDNDQGGASEPNRHHTARVPDYAGRCRDLRLQEKMWVPRYLWRYSHLIGCNGLAVYWVLAWHCTGEAPERWPSVRQIAELLHVSRSTVERALRDLRQAQLIKTEPCITQQGQKSNYWDLIDPPGEGWQSTSRGAPLAGAVADDGGAPSLVTAPPVADDGGAPSLVTAPSLQNGSMNGGEGGAAARPPSPGAAPAEEESAIARLSAQWLAQVAVRGSGPERAHREEIGPTVAELLRLGWTEEQLRASLDDPERVRFEWPRQWRERLGRPKRVAKRPARPLQTPPCPAGAIPDPPDAAQALRELTGGLPFAEFARRRAARAAKPPGESSGIDLDQPGRGADGAADGSRGGDGLQPAPID